jgi:hypothetical protein
MHVHARRLRGEPSYSFVFMIWRAFNVRNYELQVGVARLVDVIKLQKQDRVA